MLRFECEFVYAEGAIPRLKEFSEECKFTLSPIFHKNPNEEGINLTLAYKNDPPKSIKEVISRLIHPKERFESIINDKISGDLLTSSDDIVNLAKTELGKVGFGGIKNAFHAIADAFKCISKCFGG